MNAIKTIIYLVLLVSVTLYANPLTTQSKSADVLFVLYDMGDLAPMKRVMHNLELQNISYKILAFGKAQEIFKYDTHTLSLNLPECKEDREKHLDTTQLQKIEAAISPKAVIAGMASAVQAQVLNLFKTRHVYTIGFYDNFDSIEGKEYVQAFLKTIIPIDEYFLPISSTQYGFQKNEKTKLAKLSVLGQPALENWEDVFTKTDRNALRKRLNLSEKDNVVLFVGGTDNTYATYFQLFAKSMTSLKIPAKILVTYHPKTDGELEKSILKKEGVSHITVVDGQGPTTAEIATLAKIVICHKSSVGIQALYMGVPVIYVVKKGELTNFAIQQGFAYEAEDANSLLATMEKILQSPPSKKELGIPSNSTVKISARIIEILKNK